MSPLTFLKNAGVETLPAALAIVFLSYLEKKSSPFNLTPKAEPSPTPSAVSFPSKV